MNNLCAIVATYIALAWRSAWRPPERRPIYEFAAEHITFGAESPFPGKFRIINTPFIKTPCDQVRRDDIDKVSLSGVAQSAKSTFASLFCADCVANNPGSLTWNSPTKDAAKKTAEKKIWPIFRRCAPIQKILPKKGGFLTIKFPDAPLYVQTASEGNAHACGDDMQLCFYLLPEGKHLFNPIFNLSRNQHKSAVIAPFFVTNRYKDSDL